LRPIQCSDFWNRPESQRIVPDHQGGLGQRLADIHTFFEDIPVLQWPGPWRNPIPKTPQDFHRLVKNGGKTDLLPEKKGNCSRSCGTGR
jgi:hypothetical protein